MTDEDEFAPVQDLVYTASDGEPDNLFANNNMWIPKSDVSESWLQVGIDSSVVPARLTVSLLNVKVYAIAVSEDDLTFDLLKNPEKISANDRPESPSQLTSEEIESNIKPEVNVIIFFL